MCGSRSVGLSVGGGCKRSAAAAFCVVDSDSYSIEVAATAAAASGRRLLSLRSWFRLGLADGMRTLRRFIAMPN